MSSSPSRVLSPTTPLLQARHASITRAAQLRRLRVHFQLWRGAVWARALVARVFARAELAWEAWDAAQVRSRVGGAQSTGGGPSLR